MTSPGYSHRQSPLWFVVLVLGIAAIVAAVALLSGWHASLWAVGGFGAALSALFWGLRVDVDAESVTLAFGLGIIRRTIPRERIRTARRVRNQWYWGFGIRLTPHGWMWNISGLDAVELEYVDGGRFRIGTDDPAGLLAALGGSKDG